MPTPNKTMLDQLASIMKSSGRKKPEIIQQTTVRDPMGYSIEQRKTIGRNFDTTPERRIYQRGIEARLYPKKIASDELVDEMWGNRETIEGEWADAVSDAKESMRDDWESGLDNQEFEDVDPNYLEVDVPSTDLRDYWPSYARSPEEISQAFDDAEQAYYDASRAQKRIYSTRGIMDEQMLTPRYRNYQRAMMLQAENARRGRLNAKIMHLARMGYSLPEIRAMLNGTMPTPAVGGR